MINLAIGILSFFVLFPYLLVFHNSYMIIHLKFDHLNLEFNLVYLDHSLVINIDFIKIIIYMYFSC